jgi:hypothetical protein
MTRKGTHSVDILLYAIEVAKQIAEDRHLKLEIRVNDAQVSRATFDNYGRHRAKGKGVIWFSNSCLDYAYKAGFEEYKSLKKLFPNNTAKQYTGYDAVKLVAIHEIAHVIQIKNAPLERKNGNSRRSIHGGRFRRIYRNLLDKYFFTQEEEVRREAEYILGERARAALNS